MQKYKILRIKSHLVNYIKLDIIVDEYNKQFVKEFNSIDGNIYLYFKNSISDKRLIKIYNSILK